MSFILQRKREFKVGFLVVVLTVGVSLGMIFSISFKAGEVIASQGQESESLKTLEEGLVGYWSFDEGEGSIVFDSSGFSNKGTITVAGIGTSAWVKGKHGYALQFNGEKTTNGVYVNCGNNNSLMPMSAITVMAWIKVEPGGGGCILRKRSESEILGYIFEIESGKIRFVLNPGEGGWKTNRDLGGTTDVMTGTWVHVAGTYDSNTLKVYVNGYLDGVSAYTGSIKPDPDFFYIGYRETADLDYFKGLIDEVMIYERALSSSEIQAYYNMSEKDFGKIKKSIKESSNVKKWIGKGQNKTLIVTVNNINPLINNIGEGKNDFLEQFNGLLLDVGIWNQCSLKKYRIKEITWVDREILPNFKIDEQEIEAFLPDENIRDKIPPEAKILVRGKTMDNQEVPLIYILSYKSNRIINIAFTSKENMEMNRNFLLDILNYLQRNGGIASPENKWEARWGYLAKSLKFTDGKDGYQTQAFDMTNRVFSAYILINNIPTFLAINLTDKFIDSIICNTENEYKSAIFKKEDMVMANIEVSRMRSTYHCEFKKRIYVSSDRVLLWELKTVDGADYHHSKLYHINARDKGLIFLLRPDFWVEPELIWGYKIEDNSELTPVKIDLDGNLLILKSEGGQYLLYYGKAKTSREVKNIYTQTYMSFLNKIKLNIQYLHEFNINWIEL